MKALAGALALMFLVAGSASADPGRHQTRAQVIRHDIRAVSDYDPRWSRALWRAARVRALELARADAPDDHRGQGKLIYREHWTLYGEVIGWNARSTSGHWWTEAWLGSPTHRAVILARWTHMGVSCVTRVRTWCVGIFANRRR